MNSTRYLLTFACLLLLGGLACKHRPTSAITIEDLTYFAETLTRDELRGRESGSAYSRETAAFIVEQMKADGLTPAFGDTYIQEFNFNAGRKAGPDNSYELTLAVEDPAAGATPEIVKGTPSPLPFTPSTQIEGDLVFGGFCLTARDWNDFRKANVRGKVVLCLRHGPGGRENEKYSQYIPFRTKYRAAKANGAIGVLFLGRAGTKTVGPADIRARPEEGPATVFVEPEPILKALPFLKEVEASMLKGEPSDRVGALLGSIKLQSDIRKDERVAHNTGAYLYPPEPDQRVVIIGAHHDHIGMGHFSSMGQADMIHNGADDNASGVAVLLEAAAALKAGFPLPNDTNVLFLTFDGEERGLFGSRHFVKSDAFPGDRALAMINLDMVGRLRARKGMSVQGYDTGDARWRSALEAAFGEAGFGDGMQLKVMGGGFGPSDHASFYRKKMPVAFLFTGGHRDYHTERDQVELLNIEGMQAIARMTRNIVQELAEIEQPLAYRKAKREPNRTAFSFRVRLGVVPGNYDSEAEGFEVGGIRDDAPIAKSGIQEGDIIVQLDDMKIRNIQDVMAFLSDASLKTPYKVVYLRGDERKETTTELMKWR